MSDYKVGYGNPPKHTQFQPGQSGCYEGRRKSVRNFMTDLRKILSMPVRVNIGGRARNVTTQEGALMLLREKALKGDKRALGLLAYPSIPFPKICPDLEPPNPLSRHSRRLPARPKKIRKNFPGTTCPRPPPRTKLVSAWNKDPVFGVIGIQSGPRG